MQPNDDPRDRLLRRFLVRSDRPLDDPNADVQEMELGFQRRGDTYCTIRIGSHYAIDFRWHPEDTDHVRCQVDAEHGVKLMRWAKGHLPITRIRTGPWSLVSFPCHMDKVSIAEIALSDGMPLPPMPDGVRTLQEITGYEAFWWSHLAFLTIEERQRTIVNFIER